VRALAAVILGALGVAMLLAGANGSGEQLFSTLFGKGLPNKRDVPPTAGQIAILTQGAKGTAPPVSNQVVPGYNAPYSPGTHGPASGFWGTNTLAGAIA
jgi:hypothetical protein